MALIVQKFGGSSVADRDRIFNVARIVANTHAAGNDVVVVVSAQGDTTDDLIAKAGEITHDPSQREMDMLLATGEQISISLLAMALGETGCPAISLTGWQAGFHTDRAYTRARIKNLDTERIESELSKNRVVVVAGFQGLNRYDDITTLGRGGSDTSAVAIAAALHADLCQIYTDVDGVYTADPRLVPRARKLDEITFDEMLELASLGAQVLNNRSVELAKKYSVNLEVRSSLTDLPGTIVKEVTDQGRRKGQGRRRHFDFGGARRSGRFVQGVQPDGAEEDQRGYYSAVLRQGGPQGRYFHRAPGRRRNSACAAGGKPPALRLQGHCCGQGRGEGEHRGRGHAEPFRRGVPHVRGAV